MKNLIFKEFKLSVHPLVYLMMILFSLASLSGIGIIYPLILFGVIYTLIFIGIKKGVTNNDLYYSLLLPIRREKVVAARLISTTILQLIYTVIIIGISFIGKLLPETEGMLQAIGINQIFAFIGIAFILYTIFDLIYLTWFYKDGKQVIWNMLVAEIVIAIIGFSLCVFPAFSQTFFDMITVGNENANYILQIGIMLFGLLIYILGKFFLLKICTKEVRRLDF